ncbi:MAG TPA: GIY-YIG nuclease family protein [Dongiaceae bacterium]|nr:GIY-YIG nuclease family protein [Dongiaceae bacterium]
MLLIPDPRPLVERLGRDFFRQAPERPGVYLMRDAAGAVLYVGKARNLRKRLGSYRVANPERLARRHLRLLRAVARIDLEECPDETCALARESELLRTLRPRFNRAGTWPGPPRFLAWRKTEQGLDLAVLPALEEGWRCHGPLGAGASFARAALARLLWCAVHPQRGLAGLPAGWFHGRRQRAASIPRYEAAPEVFEEAAARLSGLLDGRRDEFAAWIRARAPQPGHPFELAVREADLECAFQSIGWQFPVPNRNLAPNLNLNPSPNPDESPVRP